MAYVSDTMLDAFLQYLIDYGAVMCICSAAPTSYAEATSTYMLCTNFLADTGDYAIANGDTSGRKVTIAAQSSISVTNSGTATHVAIVDNDTGSEELLAVFTCTSQALTAGNTVNTTAFDLEIRDAADE